MKTLKFKYTTSKGRDSYGYNICSLWVDGEKVSSTCGGGYDMKGTALGNWMARKFEKELLKFNKSFYGLTYHDPNWQPSKEIIKREKEGKSLGLERYQDFYKQSSKLPTEQHTIPQLDGACGFECMTSILNNMDYYLKYVDGTTNTTTYILDKKEQSKVA